MTALGALWEVPGAVAALQDAAPTTAPLLARTAALLKDPKLAGILDQVADFLQEAKRRDLVTLLERGAAIAHAVEDAGLLDKAMVLLADGKAAAAHLGAVADQAAHLLTVLGGSSTPAEAAKKLAKPPDREGNAEAGGG